jgi:predicted ATPase
MRLNKLTLGSAKESPSHQFKNLKDVTIDFDEHHWVTVVIGWNGTGKSNVLEALAIIFRELISPKRKPKVDFSFKLHYSMGVGSEERQIFIDHDPDRTTDKFVIKILNKKESAINDGEGKSIKLNKFIEDASNLPRYVFSYYSGESARMHEIFAPYLQWYDEKLRGGNDPGIKRLFYALPVHSQFVLLAFLIGDSSEISDFLKNNLGLDSENGLESVLFVLRQPPWKPRPEGDERFWGAKGVVKDFLSRLFEIALAPIHTERKVPVSLWNEKKLQFKYLFVKDINALRKLVGNQQPAEFFRDLESTYVSQLIEEVRIKVKLRKSDQSVTFRELSEGEQQLLTVLGLLKFTAEEESLFLLDEPDTHLNPRWSVDYISYLKKIISASNSAKSNSHILLTTHNPLAIAELVKEQVQVLKLKDEEGVRRVIAFYPEVDPRGMGYAAIVSSDMFGIASTMDYPTQILLEQQRILGSKKDLLPDEADQLENINDTLNGLGFRFFHPDDEYSRYLRLRNKLTTTIFNTMDTKILAESVVAMDRSERENLAKDLISELLSQNNESDV